MTSSLSASSAAFDAGADGAATGAAESPGADVRLTAPDESTASRPPAPVPADVGASPQVRRLRLIAATRVILVSVLAGIGSAWPHPASGVRAMSFLTALVWLPWSLVVFICSDTPKRALGRYGGWLVDLVMLGTAMALVPGTAAAARVAVVIVVLVGLYSCPELPMAVPLALGLAAGYAGTLAGGVAVRDLVQLAAFTVVLGTAALGWRLLARRDQEAAATASWLRNRADTIVDHMPEPVVLTSAAGRVLRWNPVCSSALNLCAGAGEPCASALNLHLGERALECSSGCALLSMVGTGADRSVEVWRPLPDGGRQPLLASVTPVTDQAGALSEVVHCFRDITRLKEADEAKTLFLATASHELKTPLTVIRGFAEMLHSGRLSDPEGQARAFEAMHVRSIELARVVDRLLLSSRIEAGRLTVRLDRVDVAEVVRTRAAALEASTHRPVSVEVVGVAGPAWADFTALTTVVDHLLDNAVKYSPEGQPVEVAIRGAQGFVHLDVRDHGIGMTAEQAQHCFEKFWQADTGDRRRFGGTGIGLYIVRSLVESMGGRIEVDSEPGRGTAFTVTLAGADHVVPEQRTATAPERSIIREFMRQIGVPGEGRT